MGLLLKSLVSSGCLLLLMCSSGGYILVENHPFPLDFLICHHSVLHLPFLVILFFYISSYYHYYIPIFPFMLLIYDVEQFYFFSFEFNQTSQGFMYSSGPTKDLDFLYFFTIYFVCSFIHFGFYLY